VRSHAGATKTGGRVSFQRPAFKPQTAMDPKSWVIATACWPLSPAQLADQSIGLRRGPTHQAADSLRTPAVGVQALSRADLPTRSWIGADSPHVHGSRQRALTIENAFDQAKSLGAGGPLACGKARGTLRFPRCGPQGPMPTSGGVAVGALNQLKAARPPSGMFQLPQQLHSRLSGRTGCEERVASDTVPLLPPAAPGAPFSAAEVTTFRHSHSD